MSLDRIIVVGNQQKTHKMVRPFTSNLFSADNLEDTLEVINTVEPDMIVIDECVFGESTAAFIKSVNSKFAKLAVIAVLKDEDDAKAESLISFGAFDCINGESDVSRLGRIIDKVKYSSGNRSKEEVFFADDCPASVSIVGKSPSITNSLKMIKIVAKSACNPVLVIGETGTGKELAAKAVHILRHGSGSKFVAVNCAALTANLLESELFGHVKGSFTSADTEKTGLFEIAENGTIFLDEISEMPLDLQAKLLRVIQEQTFRKVGGTKEIKCNATVIASSNLNLLKEVEEGKFRKDLYYRLSVFPITLAPLRHPERKEDIPLLAEYFLRTSVVAPDKTPKIRSLTKLALETLKKHDWPGNVRELCNVIDRAILMETTEKIGCNNLMLTDDLLMENPESSAICSFKDFSLENAEKELIGRALQESNGQKTRAAALLGITRATLYAKVKQYNIPTANQQVAVSA
ncbi:MAG: sigma-54 dependent transcriptional regulator [Phycisphaerae bacterium]|nr:sigma-54 dependent transcriptional regulator [Phycisphaerae bacterium]